jgi:hypothetical protein
MEDGTALAGATWSVNLHNSQGDAVAFTQGWGPSGLINPICSYETGSDGTYQWGITELPTTPGVYTLEASATVSGTTVKADAAITIHDNQVMTLLVDGESSISLVSGSVSNYNSLNFGGKLSMEDGTPLSGITWGIKLYDSTGAPVNFTQGISGTISTICSYTTGSDGSYGYCISGLPTTPGVYTLEASATVSGTTVKADAAITIHDNPVMTLNTTPTAAPGTVSGDTAIIASSNTAGDPLAVEVSTSGIATPNVGDPAPTGSSVTNPYISGSNLTASAGDYVGVFELNSSNEVVAFNLLGPLAAGDICTASSSGLSISPTSTTGIGSLNVTISDTNLSTGEYIYYNTGEEPSAVSNAIYTDSPHAYLTVSVSETVYAQVYGSGIWGSAVWETYTIVTATPVITSPVYAGSDVSVSGTAAPGASIVLYDNGAEKGTATANSSRAWTISSLTLASGDVLTATAQVSGQSTSSASSSVTVATSSSGSGSSGGGGSTKVANNTGAGTITSSVGGTVWLNNEAGVTIPKGALQGSTNATISVASASTPPAPPAGDTLVGAYEFTVNGGGYTFGSAVTLTFTFDPSKIPAGDVPVVEYYDNTTDSWVLVTSTVNGDTITVTVDHFTIFAVMAVPQTATVTTAPAAASTFSDVPSSFWGYDAISSLSGKGIISGYPDGTFRPDNEVTRAEFATMLVKALGLSASGTASQFMDVTAGDWYYNSVNSTVSAGLVSGMGNGLFAPNALVTREQMAVMVAEALGRKAPTIDGTGLDTFTDQPDVSTWAVTGLEEAVKAGIITGIIPDTLAPLDNATRAQAAEMIYKLLGVLGR